MSKGTIMIIDDNTSFREGLKKLFEIKFGLFCKIIDTDSTKASKYKNMVNLKLIIINRIGNSEIERFLIDMKKKGSKIVLLSSEPENLHEYIELYIFCGFLLKKMPTNQLFTVIEGIMEHDDVYVHPDIGYSFLRELLKISING